MSGWVQRARRPWLDVAEMFHHQHGGEGAAARHSVQVQGTTDTHTHTLSCAAWFHCVFKMWLCCCFPGGSSDQSRRWQLERGEIHHTKERWVPLDDIGFPQALASVARCSCDPLITFKGATVPPKCHLYALNNYSFKIQQLDVHFFDGRNKKFHCERKLMWTNKCVLSQVKIADLTFSFQKYLNVFVFSVTVWLSRVYEGKKRFGWRQNCNVCGLNRAHHACYKQWELANRSTGGRDYVKAHVLNPGHLRGVCVHFIRFIKTSRICLWYRHTVMSFPIIHCSMVLHWS